MCLSGKQCALVLFVISFPLCLVCIYRTLTNTAVREYHRTLSFQETKCSVQGVEHHGRTPCEYMVDVYYHGYEKVRVLYGAQPAKRSDHSYRPCIEVIARYRDVEGVIRNGTLYQHYTLLSGKGQHCSFADCGPDENTTGRQVADNLSKLSRASEIKCYYNTKDYRQAILMKITFSQVVSTVWFTGLISLIGCVVVSVVVISMLVVAVKLVMERCTCNFDKFQGKLKVLINERYITVKTDDTA